MHTKDILAAELRTLTPEQKLQRKLSLVCVQSDLSSEQQIRALAETLEGIILDRRPVLLARVIVVVFDSVEDEANKARGR